MYMFATSVLFQGRDSAGELIVSHSVHYQKSLNHHDALSSAIADAERLKPHMKVVSAICVNTDSNTFKCAEFPSDECRFGEEV